MRESLSGLSALACVTLYRPERGAEFLQTHARGGNHQLVAIGSRAAL